MTGQRRSPGPAAQPQHLSRRERQMMDVLYRLGEATAAEAMRHLPDPPSYSAVRSTLRLLVEKGLLRHRREGPRYVYMPTVNRKKASHRALRHVLKTFFDGSIENAVAALMDMSTSELEPEELRRIVRMIEAARKEGR